MTAVSVGRRRGTGKNGRQTDWRADLAKIAADGNGGCKRSQRGMDQTGDL